VDDVATTILGQGQVEDQAALDVFPGGDASCRPNGRGCHTGARPSCSRLTPVITTTGPTLHQLRHSRLTHAAENCASTPVLMKLSGHTSVRSLAKYARVSDEGLLNFQADTDPAARRHVQRSGGQSVAGEEHDEH
jgi:integrase